MKKTITISAILTTCIFVAVSQFNMSNASASLPPNAHAGAPMDASGQTCVACHAGVATPTSGIISSDIPSSGFVPGSTYNFSVTMSGASAYGFEITPQTSTSSAGVGTLISGVGSAISSKYIKQTAKKTGSTALWTFQWTAPSTGTTVTFYGAFNYADNNGGVGGDLIRTSSVTYTASSSTGIELLINDITLSVFPNPTHDILNVSSVVDFKIASIYSIDGRLVKIISESELISKKIDLLELNSGVYYLKVTTNNDKEIVKQFIKN